MTGFNERQRPKGLRLFKTLALLGFAIDIITFGAIFVVLGHDVGGPFECTAANGLCPGTTKIYQPNHLVILTPGWADPFTTTSTTPVCLPGFSSIIKPFGPNHPIWPVFLIQLTTKISAGTGYYELQLNGTASGSGGVFSSTNYQTSSYFLGQNTTAAPWDGVTSFSICVFSDSVTHTVSVLGSDPAFDIVSLVTVEDVSTNPGTSATPP